MNTVLEFLEEHLISTIEAVVSAHEPALQAELLYGLKILSERALDWIGTRLDEAIALHPDAQGGTA